MNRTPSLWKRLGFSHKVFLSLGLCLFFCLLLVAGYTRTTTRDTMRRNAVETGLAATNNKATLLELNLAQIDKLSSNVYSNVDVYSLLRQPTLSNTQCYRISLFLRSMMSMSSEVNLNQIYLDIYSSGQSFIINSGGNSSYGPSRYHVAIPSEIEAGQVYCSAPHLPNTYGYSLSSGSTDVFTFHWKLYDNAQTHVIGTISFDISLDDMLSYVFADSRDIGFLMSTGNIIFSNNCTLTNQEARSVLRNCIQDHWSEIHEPFLDGIAFFSSINLSNVQMQLVQTIPADTLYGESDDLLLKNLVIITIAFLICGLLMFLIIRRLMHPIQQLDSGLQQIRTQNNLKLRMKDNVNYHGEDEIGRLILQTDSMLDTVEELFQRQEMLSKAQRDAEARMLQAQINPHFLYNSLQSLAGLALERGQRDIYRYITMLGSRMHYCMDMDNTTAFLSQEFDYVRNYLVLQNVRFGSGIEEHFSLSPEASQIIVPRMILQPIIENAFKHGKLCRLPNTYMSMSGEVTDHILTIIMENNGHLIPSDRVDELNRLFSAPGVPHTPMTEHIGMLSVLYRLRLYFSDAVTMTLSQPENRCVRITIRIPLPE